MDGRVQELEQKLEGLLKQIRSLSPLNASAIPSTSPQLRKLKPCRWLLQLTVAYARRSWLSGLGAESWLSGFGGLSGFSPHLARTRRRSFQGHQWR